jgi:hypothetical protein
VAPPSKVQDFIEEMRIGLCDVEAPTGQPAIYPGRGMYAAQEFIVEGGWV